MPTFEAENKPPCQFFGFHVSADKTQMKDSCDSSCALECQSQSPCLYADPAEHGHGPDWTQCVKHGSRDYQPLITTLNQAQVKLSTSPDMELSMWDWRRVINGGERRQSATA